MASWKNRPTTEAILQRTPRVVKDAVAGQLKTEIDGLTEAIRRAAPITSDLDKVPGQLRASVHSGPTRRELQYFVTADAQDDKGNYIAPHVEHGHKSPDGSHVAAVPFVFPTYRARKPSMRRRILAASRAALKTKLGI